MHSVLLPKSDVTYLTAEEEYVVEAIFHTSIYVELGDGRKALFWTDHWLQRQSLLDLAPFLCDAVGTGTKKNENCRPGFAR
jgi:hypothetical protein